MEEYEQPYKIGRMVCKIVEVFGWIAVVLGILFTLLSLVANSLIGGALREMSGGDLNIAVRIFSLFPGVIVSFAGLMIVMLAQHTRAAFNISDTAFQLLEIAKGDVPAREGARLNAPRKSGKFAVYRGIKMYAEGGEVRVNNKVFSSTSAARSYIDSKLGG